jgi:hypothetical protein
MRRNAAAERVREWDGIWEAYVHALQLHDPDLLACARRAMADFDRRHGTRPIRGLQALEAGRAGR